MKVILADRNKWIHIAIIMVAIFAAYFKIFHAPFSTWDDDARVVNNADIRGISWKYISEWFSRFYVGDYQPLSMFTYALDYIIGKQQPFIYHFTNIAIHACNAVILFFLILKIQKNNTVALFTALLFALHPVQTESVSWIAEQQTVLCTFFYLLALLQYASYVTKPLGPKLLSVFLFGVAAMLSKALAVTLPVSLLAVHVLMNRNFKLKKAWLLIIPLLLASLFTGIAAIQGQESGNWLNRHPGYTHWETILLASFNYTEYIFHLIVPVHLSVMYPYPDSIGVIHYLYLLFTAGILAIAVIAWRKHWDILCGGILSYTINIALLLQLLQYGEYMMADRFLYIAGIGILFPLVYYPVTWLQKKGKQIIAVVSYTVIALSLLIATFIRNNIWLSELNFVNSMVEQFPNSTVAQYSVGALYLKNGNYKDAEIHINRAVQLDPHNYKAWYDKGVLYLRERKVNESLDALNKCLAIYPFPDAYFSRALLYMGTGRPALALADAEKNLDAEPTNARAWYIKGNCIEQQGNIELAIENYSKAISYEDTEALFYLMRGQAYAKINQARQALIDFNKAISLDSTNAMGFYYRGLVKYQSGGNPCDDFSNAIAKGYRVPADIVQKACNSIAQKQE